MEVDKIVQEEDGLNGVGVSTEGKSEEMDCDDKLEKATGDYKSVKTVIDVHSQVNVESCPNRKLLDKYVKSIEAMILRYDHLKRNITKIEFLDYSSRQYDGSQQFSLRIGLKLSDDTSGLWENARSYVWKHLGQLE